jgi:hypothetical protein
MNSFEYDFSAAIEYEESNLIDNAELLSKIDVTHDNIWLYQNCLDSLLGNILRRVQSNDIDYYDLIISDVNLFLDILDSIKEKGLTDSVSMLFKNKISSERISSLFFVLSHVVGRNSFYNLISSSTFSKCRYLTFLCDLWVGKIARPDFDCPGYKSLSSISSSTASTLITDFLDIWPTLLKKELIAYAPSRHFWKSNEGAWTGDDCYVAMLLSFLFAVDHCLDFNEEYLPTNLMTLFKGSFPIYGLLSKLEDESLPNTENQSRGFNSINSNSFIDNKDFSFLFDAIFGYAPVDYSTSILSGLSDSKSSNVLQFLGDVNTLEYDTDIYETLGFTYLILVDRKDNEELIHQLSNITENIFGQGFEFDFLACTDTMSTIQSFNSALSQHGSYLYLLDLQADNLVLFVTKKEFVGKLDEIFSSL